MLGFPSALRHGSAAIRSGSGMARYLSTSAPAFNAPVKVPVALIAKLRKTHPVPMAQAREALEKSNLDVDAAVAYLSSATSASAQKKAAKVADRVTSEGTVAVSLLGGRRVAMVQLACETDFVARNDVFLKAARGIAETAAFLDVPTDDPASPVPQPAQDAIQVFPNDALLSAPLISVPADGTTAAAPSDEAQTVQQVLLASLQQTSENLKLVRAASFAAPFPSTPTTRMVPGAYTHGGDDTTGKVGGIVVLSVEGAGDKPIAAMIAAPEGAQLDTDLQALARNLARQVVGFPTKALVAGEGVEDEEALLSQTAMLLGSDQKVADVVAKWGEERGVKVSIVDMRRWAVGDAIEA
ncbi:Elongation factor Ts, mitochondrial [Apiotrichum porosum]|uniref:Elongation factor Ts, mitochondrial n=1 Tax=Apiotrichum porosum TaxID=105984 RepID=A0A427XZM7_9TREE|nr:Elongation factor Ts, mitochondrial [Apiotrichum porosum]RSH84185.1 Elongation factor Ts, mitochondrial [Apiotrichum porosum]